ncbi:MAG: hypothetical protein SGILL_007191 [Bacillariaceae sp.]
MTRDGDVQQGAAPVSEHETIADQTTRSSTPSPSSSLWIPMISNFSTSYNVVNISLVLPILEQVHNATSEDAAACASSLLAGMIVGQLMGGALGDSRLGRIGALRLVMALQIVASIASASLGLFVVDKDSFDREDIFLRLAAFRFFLGIGCGGVYPLAAVLSAEQGKEEGAVVAARSRNAQSSQESETQDIEEEKDHDSIHRVVLTFSTQGMGFVTVPIVADPLSEEPESEDTPAISLENQGQEASVVSSEVNENDASQTDGILLAQPPGGSWLRTLFNEPGLGRKVLGTAGTWFLFDVVFYGNTIFQPIVVEAAFGGSKSHEDGGIDLLRKAATDSLILTSIALPGYAVAGFIMGKKTCCITQTPRYVMLQGFAAMTVLYATIGANWSYLRGYPAMLVFLYGMTFFFANYGPNTTTFILPSLIFEQEHRATWNGVSAAAGKLGALTGATFFEPAADEWGDGAVMVICAVVAIMAFVLTFVAVPKQRQEQEERIENTNDIGTNGEMA